LVLFRPTQYTPGSIDTRRYLTTKDKKYYIKNADNGKTLEVKDDKNVVLADSSGASRWTVKLDEEKRKIELVYASKQYLAAGKTVLWDSASSWSFKEGSSNDGSVQIYEDGVGKWALDGDDKLKLSPFDPARRTQFWKFVEA